MLRGLATILLLGANLIFWGVPVLLSGIVKLFLPGLRRAALVRWVATRLGDGWVAANNRILDRMLPVRWEIDDVEGADPAGHFLILSNHVSWVDIVVLFRAFHDRTPFIRFFLKSELIWFPIVGQACWALDFPFMKRNSPELLERHPELRGEDLETTRKACRKYRKLPVSILNFVEGTRFSERKRITSGAPYRHLLRPRTGGVAFVLASLGEQLDAIYDVTLIYPGGEMTMWNFARGRIRNIIVRIRRIEVPAEFITAEVTQPGELRDRFRSWMEALWREKDELIEAVMRTE